MIDPDPQGVRPFSAAEPGPVARPLAATGTGSGSGSRPPRRVQRRRLASEDNGGPDLDAGSGRVPAGEIRLAPARVANLGREGPAAGADQVEAEGGHHAVARLVPSPPLCPERRPPADERAPLRCLEAAGHNCRQLQKSPTIVVPEVEGALSQWLGEVVCGGDRARQQPAGKAGLDRDPAARVHLRERAEQGRDRTVAHVGGHGGGDPYRGDSGASIELQIHGPN